MRTQNIKKIAAIFLAFSAATAVFLLSTTGFAAANYKSWLYGGVAVLLATISIRMFYKK